MTEQLWDGTTRSTHLSPEGHAIRKRLADVAKAYDWVAVMDVLKGNPELVNSSRPDGRSRYAPLHQAAHGGAPVGVVNELIKRGAWRGLREAKGERPIDIAMRKGHRHLLGVLDPPEMFRSSANELPIIEGHFHTIIKGRAGTILKNHRIRLPELEVMRELERPQLWFPVPFMSGGFWFNMEKADGHLKLVSLSWSHDVERSARRHEITMYGAVDQPFPAEARDLARV